MSILSEKADAGILSVWRHARFLSAFAIGMLIAAPSASAAGCTWVYAGNGTNEHALQQGGNYISFDPMSLNNGSFWAKARFYEVRRRNEFPWTTTTYEPVTIDTGEAKGRIDGNLISFVIAWSGGPKGDYKGSIDIYGNVAGTTVDVRNPESSASWTWAGFTCVPIAEPTTSTPESSAPKKIKGLGKRKMPLAVKEADRDLFKGVMPKGPAQPPPQQTATAIDDVDIHKLPDGQSERYDGFMPGGTQAPVLEHHADGWYRLQLNVPGGSGWVAEDHLTVKP